MANTVEAQILHWLQLQPAWIHRLVASLAAGEAPNALLARTADEALQAARRIQLDRPDSLNLRGYESAESEVTFVLEAIKGVYGVNRIQDNAELTFPSEDFSGLAIFYGPNGSGKTGFARILKATAGRLSIHEILPDVFESNSTAICWEVRWRTKEAEFKCAISQSAPPDCLLECIQIFDESVAQAYRTEDKELSLTPPILRIFDDIVYVLDGSKRELESRIRSMPTKLPNAPPALESAISKTKFSQIETFKNEAEIRENLRFTDTQEQELSRLRSKLELFASDAITKALKKKIESAASTIVELEGYGDLFTVEKATKFRNLQIGLSAAQKIVLAANSIVDNESRLVGVGTNPWLDLWEAARTFSQTIVYSERTFPVTDNDAKCVLCHQDLSPSAKTRLTVFEEFVKGTAAKELRRAQGALSDAVKTLPQDVTLDALVVKLRDFEGLEFDSDVLAKFRAEIAGRIAILGSDDPMRHSNAPAVGEIIKRLRGIFDEESQKYSQATDPAKKAERDSVKTNFEALEAQKWVAEQLESVIAEWKRQKRVEILRQADISCSTTEATSQKGRLYEQTVTREVRDRFSKELDLLGARRLRVQMTKTRSSKAKVLHKPTLIGAIRPTNTTLVLSEGEQRVIALAAFLADTATVSSTAPFIFDDPVSSLDHRYEKSLARRVAQLSRTRQVIVFTHRLSLVYSLENAVKDVSGTCCKRGLHSNDLGTGIVDEFPMDRDPSKIANDVITECKSLKKDLGILRPDEIRKQVITQSARMRRATEQAVEKILLQGIVKRFDQAVHTDIGLEKLLRIELSDCEFLDRLMTTYSREIHDQSEEIDDTPVDVDTIENDATEFVQWVISFKKRSK